MKTAISTDNGQVSAHFGRCPEFTIVDIEKGKLIKQETIQNPGHEPGFLPEYLGKKGVKAIVAGGMGPRAQGLFAEKGIDTIIGVTGSVEDTIAKMIAGTLKSGQSFCTPGAGRGYGIAKSECDHPHKKEAT
jgi:predicted Fe-Mo cluster-binding NifX family protein